MKDWRERDILLMLVLNNEYILQHYCKSPTDDPKSSPILTIFHFFIRVYALLCCTAHILQVDFTYPVQDIIFKIVLPRIFLEQH